MGSTGPLKKRSGMSDRGLGNSAIGWNAKERKLAPMSFLPCTTLSGHALNHQDSGMGLLDLLRLRHWLAPGRSKNYWRVLGGNQERVLLELGRGSKQYSSSDRMHTQGFVSGFLSKLCLLLSLKPWQASASHFSVRGRCFLHAVTYMALHWENP